MVADSIQHSEQTLMFTDIVGYSRLMGRNELLAVEMLGDYRRILLSHIEAQGGQLVEFVGDAIFARFNTATAAVAAAIAIQQHLLAFNEARDKKLPRLQTRIGLHKGEVMLRDGAVYGDSVNIAARLEPLAVADGICISQSVYDEIRFSLSSPAKRLGLQTLKNIQQKIRVYLIKPAGIGWRDHLHYFLRALNKAIVAYRYPLTACVFAIIAAGFYFIPRWLVPGYTANYVEIADFRNLMDEKGESDYFSAGITAAVRSQLADMRDVYIVDPKEGVHAPIRLEGSVQRLGDNLRIAYRLFRRKDNVQIAGGKLDGTYQDIFILQDRLVGEIARYLADEFDLQNFRPAPLRLTGDVTAYDYYLQGMEFLNSPAMHESVDNAVQKFSAALVHDENFALANTGICESYWRKYELTSSAKWLNDAEHYCLQALKQDGRLIRAYKTIGAIYRDSGKYDKAIEYLNAGRLIDEFDVTTVVALASVYDLVQEKDKAEILYKEAILHDPYNWRAYDGYGYFLTKSGRYDEAIEQYEKVLSFTLDNPFVLNNIGINFLYKNEFGRAAEAFEAASHIEPSSSVYANTGSMYYFSENYLKALEMYKKALRLEPANYQWMASIADTCKYIPEKRHLATEYFQQVIKYANEELSINPNIARAYQYLARAYGGVGDMESAKKMMDAANHIDSTSTESLYTNLRIAVLMADDDSIKKYASSLLDAEYSDKLILSDPDFSVLKESRFQSVFINQK
ncbi:adenylate/guanylate cyclase domain-containing protein [Cellvibrio sp. pealriver]|uniref:adenylate/guanylate cyclase domain-containing protein n=1 Tax=Cellvibrio sp. pealriver TaxID=1622269 RepID=UPI00066FCF7A|nr:adenylate/guanylate cyclase domain-containing protein [Cellvibrio sp. pealriver]